MPTVKRIISFEDIDGNPVTEEWYFSLGKTDVLDMEVAHRVDVVEYLTTIVKERRSRDLLTLFRDLLMKSVGKRSGNRLDKSEAIVQEFKNGGAYEQLFSELLEMDDAGASFFNSMMPKDVQEQIAEKANRVYTPAELLAMTDDEFYAAVGTSDIREMSKEHMQVAFQRKSNAA